MNWIGMDLHEKIKKVLSKKRYSHTLGVQYTSACLAMKYGCDIQKAGIAGLLHDNAKCITDEGLLNQCMKYNISISEVERRNPYLLHAKLGAYFAQKEYFIDDENIINAIIFHTTGRPNMSLLEKIVFVADYIEPNRKQLKCLEEIRKQSFENLDKAVYMILEQTLLYLKEEKEDNSLEIDELTVKSYEYYKAMLF